MQTIQESQIEEKTSKVKEKAKVDQKELEEHSLVKSKHRTRN